MGQTWEADKMLDVYIYDYLVKRNLQATAKAFMAEGKVATGPVAIDAPGGFLFEWWSVFWDIFIARTNENHSDAAAAYFKVQQLKNKDQLLLRQYQLMQQRQAVQFHQLRNVNPPPNGSISDGILGSSAASPLAANVYGEHLKNPNSINSETLKSVDSNQGQLIQGHAGNISLALQQIQGRNLQSTDIRPGSGVSPRPLPGDPSTLYGQRAGQGKAGLGGSSGFQGASGSAMLDGWPLTSEQLLSNLGPQASRPFLQSSNQYHQVLTADQQQLMVQTHMQGDIGNSHGFGGMDPQRFRTLQRAGLNVKDGQPNGNDGQVGSPLQTSSPMVKNEQAELLMKTRMSQMQSMAQKPQDHMLQQHQLQQNNRKRKPSSSGAANSSGPSNSQPSTPSTNNTQGDGVATANDMPHASSMAKSSMMYGSDGVRTLGSSSNHMDDLENLGDIGALEDQMESFFSQDGDGRDLFAQDSPPENIANTSKEHGGDQNHGHPRT